MAEDTAPAKARLVALQKPPDHLGCELLDVPARQRLLGRLREQQQLGLRSPELLYLGGRIAASLGLCEEARLFLDPLSEALHEGDEPSPAYFPVGLLYLQVLPQGDESKRVLDELRVLAAGSTRLASVLDRLGLSEGRLLTGTPSQLLSQLRDQPQGAGRAISQLAAHPDEADDEGMRDLLEHQFMAHLSARAYMTNDLHQARSQLEALLLRDGDQPDVLRNLIMVTAEQQDVEAYERYWRRYVKVLLWRIMRGQAPGLAYGDLIRFYARVASATNREFGETQSETTAALCRHPLVARWTESHAALAWLTAAVRHARAHQTGLSHSGEGQDRAGLLSLMRTWFDIFYPEFSPFVVPGGRLQDAREAWSARPRQALRFDPAERLVTQFAQWSKCGLGLKSDSDEHARAVVALAACVARVPLWPYVRTVAKAFNDGQFNPQHVRKAMREACSLPLGFRLGEFFQAEDWEGMLRWFGDPDLKDALSARLQLFVALAHCRTGQEQKGFQAACACVPAMTADDLQPETDSRALWKAVIHATVSKALETNTDVEKRLEAIRKRVRGFRSQVEGFEAFRDELLEDVEQGWVGWILREKVEKVIARSKELVEANDFDGARIEILDLPDSPRDIGELKTNLLSQIDGAEEAYNLHRRVDAAISKAKDCVERGRFSDARAAINALPSTPDDLRELKKQLLGQIDEAQEQHGLKDKVDAAIARAQQRLSAGDIVGAMGAIDELPDYPSELSDLKRNLKQQIMDALMNARRY